MSEDESGMTGGKAITGIFRSLACRNFRLFFIGQGISLIGTWVQRIALPWLVYQYSGSTFMLGLVAFSGLAPSFVMAPVAGVLIDRWSRYHVVMAVQILSLFQALLLAFMFYTGNLSIGIILVLNIFLGIINAFEMPSRQAFLLELIDNKNDYCNAMAVSSLIVNGSRLIGPSLAGVMILLGGEGLCFAFNSASYLAVIVSLLMIKITSAGAKEASAGFFQEMKQGFAYAFGFPSVKNVLLLYGLVCFTGWPSTVLMPAISRELLQGGAGTFSALMTASGAGALIGALYLGSRKNLSGLYAVITWATVLLGSGVIALSFSRNLALSMAVMAVIGACIMVIMAASVSFIQAIIDESKRGIIMSMYTMIFTGAASAGCYLAGELSTRIGTPATLVMGGLACVIGALAFIVRMTDCYEVKEL